MSLFPKPGAVPAATAAPAEKRTRVRWLIVTTLFLVTSINYADRATLSITSPAISQQYGINAITMGYLFSAFGWSYVLGQLPGGWMLDRFGSKPVYLWSLLFWSLFTIFQGWVGFGVASVGFAVTALFAGRFCVGLAEAPSMPANSRIVAQWFPTAERGTSVALFNSAQYFATALFIPIMSAITYRLGWQSTFLFMGGIGLLFVPVMMRMITNPAQNKLINRAELAFLREGGALVDTDQPDRRVAAPAPPSWTCIKQLLRNRMMLGIFIGQYSIATLTYFFLTWFPVYLVKERHMSILKVGFVAVLPALCGCLGGLIGGAFSDLLLRRGYTLSLARKTPIIGGMLLSTCMVLCNYVNTDFIVVAVMALAFFGKGIGALGWTVIVDTAPREIMGLTSGLFNLFGNVAAITTPIAIGYIVEHTGSFNGALLFVSANAMLAIVSFVFIVPKLHRMELWAGKSHGTLS